MKKKIKPIMVYAVIQKRNNKIDILDIFAKKDVGYTPTKEYIVKVKIEVAE